MEERDGKREPKPTLRLESQRSTRGGGEKPRAWHRAVRAGSGLWAQPDGCKAVRAPGSTLGSCIPTFPQRVECRAGNTAICMKIQLQPQMSHRTHLQ